jgi:uncharacterized protein
MKQSNYNYLIRKDQSVYCFNGISKFFFKIPIEQQNNVETILKFPNDYEEKLPSFYKLLTDGNFIIDDNHDELSVIRRAYQKATNEGRSFMLTILPTIGCNFNCWYCVQDHRPVMMSNEIVEKVKKHIDFVLENENIDNLHIEWFGGEPFIGFKSVIRPISYYALEQCKKHGVSFTNTATTNGFLISELIAKELNLLKFEMFQITLDGEREHHDRTRVANGVSSFDKILYNINLICKYVDESRIMLRINYDNQNLDVDRIFDQLNRAIPQKNRNKIDLLFRKVWQVESVENAEEKIMSLISRLEEIDFRFYGQSDLVLNNIPCYASNKKMRLISPNGTINKCTARENFEDSPLGKLNDDGTIAWIDNLPVDEIYAKPLFENDMCLSCKYLPLCMGPCPRDIDVKNTDTYKAYCKNRSNDIKTEDSILMLCERMN